MQMFCKICPPASTISEASMIRRLLTALVMLSAASLATPGIGHAQTFKVEKFDIKGDGGTDYVTVEAATGRVFVARATHVMVIEGATGKVLGDIPNTPGVHGVGIAAVRRKAVRSEEHTSELQSRFDLVCRLLLEKKKKKRNYKIEPESERLRNTQHEE